MELYEGEFARAINGHDEIAPAFLRLKLGNIDVKEAGRVGFELLLCTKLAVYIRKPTDPMSLKASMQRRPRQVRY